MPSTVLINRKVPVKIVLEAASKLVNNLPTSSKEAVEQLTNEGYHSPALWINVLSLLQRYQKPRTSEEFVHTMACYFNLIYPPIFTYNGDTFSVGGKFCKVYQEEGRTEYIVRHYLPSVIIEGVHKDPFSALNSIIGEASPRTR